MDLRRQVILITEASSGIGRVAAKLLAPLQCPPGSLQPSQVSIDEILIRPTQPEH